MRRKGLFKNRRMKVFKERRTIWRKEKNHSY